MILCVLLLSIYPITREYMNSLGIHIKLLSTTNQVSVNEEIELYRNLFITLLHPYVEEAIDNYYNDYLKYLPREDLFDYNILSIKRIPNHNYSYVIKLEVVPFVGPHLSVGIDHITLTLDLNGVKVLKFKHIKSYPLPPHYQDITIQWPPNQ